METLGLETLGRSIFDALAAIAAQLARFAPRLVGAAVILLVGWAIASLAGGLTRRIAARAGLDRAAVQLGLDDTLAEAGLPRDASHILGLLAFWLTLLAFAVSAVDALGLAAATRTLERVVAFVPDLMGAGVILVVGLLLARFAGELVAAAAVAARMAFARALARSVRGLLGVVVAIVALAQLGVDTAVLRWGLITLLGSVVFALALAFALGSREVVRGILAGYYLRRSLVDRGDVLIDGRRGRLDRIGPVHSVFVSEEGSWFVPNAELLSMRIDRPARRTR